MKNLAETDPFDSQRSTVIFTTAAFIGAVLIGLIGGGFRWFLHQADEIRHNLSSHLNDFGILAPLIAAAVVAICAVVGRLLVTAIPRTAGSGIQDVEAVWHEQDDLPNKWFIPVKFLGGIVAIGSGLIVGREGPAVHLGAATGAEVGRWFKLSDYERKLLYTTVGGAGLAVAFNAPLAGALFTVEEVTKSFRLRVVLVTLLSTSVAVATSRLIIPGEREFLVGSPTAPPFTALFVYGIFGLITGVIAVAYNKTIMSFLERTDLSRMNPTVRAGLIGAVMGALLWIDPMLAGGGAELNQRLLEPAAFPIATLVLYLAVRFVAGPLSYAAGTPGGLFAPLLVIGALWGVLFYDGIVALGGTELVGKSSAAFALVGMVAFFAGTVRAPLTAVAVVIEMSGATSLTIMMFAACAGAMLAGSLLKAPSIYDSLRKRMLRNNRRLGPRSRTRVR